MFSVKRSQSLFYCFMMCLILCSCQRDRENNPGVTGAAVSEVAVSGTTVTEAVVSEAAVSGAVYKAEQDDQEDAKGENKTIIEDFRGAKEIIYDLPSPGVLEQPEEIFLSNKGKAILYEWDDCIFYEARDGKCIRCPGKSPLQIFKKKEKVHLIFQAIQCENGDYLLNIELDEIALISSSGNLKKRLSVLKLLGIPKTAYTSYHFYYAGDGKVVISVDTGKLKNTCYYVDILKEKILWKIKDSDDVLALDEKGYVYIGYYDYDNYDDEDDENVDYLVVQKIKLASGEIISEIPVQEIRNTGKDFEQLDFDGEPYNQQSIAYTCNKGKLYAKYISGIFVLDEKKGKWRQILDGTKQFEMGASYTDHFVIRDNHIYLLGVDSVEEDPCHLFGEYILEED